MNRRKTMTEKLQAKSARAARSQKRGAEVTARLQRGMSAGEALIAKTVLAALRHPGRPQSKRMLASYPAMVHRLRTEFADLLY